jgi:hypothetical protein
VAALLEEAKRLVEEGVEARLAHADVGAAEAAESDRRQLLEIKGDANRATERRAAVAEVAEG